MQEFINRARLNPARIIFPEGQDERIRKAVKEIKQKGIAKPILFGKNNLEDIPSDVEVLDPYQDDIFEKCVQDYYELRKNKGFSLEAVRKLLQENVVFIASLLVRRGFADAFIAGASHTTKDVAKSVIYCIGPKENRSISSCFIIDTGKEEFGYKGKFIFADCGVILNPTAQQLADIAVDSGELFKKLFEAEPYIAFLSYSTHGSASGESVTKIRDALEILRSERPDLNVDGELQADSAIVEEVAKIKCPQSKVAGKANILIFPDLNSGNICYKLVDRLLYASALGPIFLGTKKPASDLSRGCEVNEVVLIAAVISIMSQLQKMSS